MAHCQLLSFELQSLSAAHIQTYDHMSESMPVKQV